jgi:hypothetical protein
MKKQMKWLLAALALAALATPAFAVTADMTGSLSVRAFNTSDFTKDPDISRQRFVDQRLRLFTSVAANENVKAVLGLEVDNVWGRASFAPAGAGALDPKTNAAGKEIGALGADAKGQLEIKHLYLDFTLPESKVNVKAGTQPFNLGRGLIINDDAAGLLASIPCPVVAGNTLSLYWIKPSEGAIDKKTDESDFYAVKYAAKAGDLTVAPYVGYLNAGTDSFYGDKITAYFVGADVDGKVGALGYGATAIFNSWKTGNLVNMDGSSIALIAKADYTLGGTKLMAEIARYGDKDAGGDLVSLKDPTAYATGPINNFSEILTGGMYTSNAGNVNVGGANNLYSVNYMYLKAGAKQKLSDAMSVSGYVMHIQQAEDTAAKAITYGQEADLYFDYAINPALGVNVMAAYLLADKDFNNDKDLSKLGVSLNYKF